MQELILTLALFLPLIGFLFLTLSYMAIPRNWAGFIATGIIFASLALFSYLLYHLVFFGLSSYEVTWFPIVPLDPIEANFTLRADSLSLWMTLIVTGVGGLIHLFSIGYMKEDPGVIRYFACLNFFVFAMLLLVLSGDLLLFFFGWEAVGLASYLLIGFWFEKKSAAKAATKAFVVNRLADCALLLGLVLTYTLFHTSDIEKILALAPTQAEDSELISWIAFLFFVGASGKSAQLPLHLWLPDAMEGPTPVSALIHAATMVTAGVFFIVKMETLFLLSPPLLYLIAIIGGATALYGAISASFQSDLKRVLAYSTISQLGFMFLACGLGAFYTAMFHLTTHAFMKALLFLAAGTVIHSLHDITSMDRMGGLHKKLPLTSWLFLLGILAMSGIPPLSAFFSKDLILEEGWAYGFEFLFISSLLASFFTAFYLSRAYCLTFLGELTKEKVEEMRPWTMIVPMIFLALFSIFGGFLGAGFNNTPPLERLLHHLHISRIEEELTTHFSWSFPLFLSLITALLGIGVAFLLYARTKNRPTWRIEFLEKAFYLDDLANYIFVKPYQAISSLVERIVEPFFFEKPQDRLASLFTPLTALVQKMQGGYIRSYSAWIILGSVLWMIVLVFRSFA